MMNEEKKQEYYRMKKELQDEEAAGNIARRNELVKPLSELGHSIDWGFKKGEIVERRLANRWERDTILEVAGSDMIFRTMIMPFSLVRKAQEKQEQLTIF